jgi:DNA repair protein RadD
MLDLTRNTASRNINLQAVELYSYQRKIVEDVDRKIAAGIKRMLISGPTGSGKTVIASNIIESARAKGQHVLFVAHRDELLTQARDKLKSFGVNASIIKAGREQEYYPWVSVQVAGIQTLHARAIRTNRLELPPANILFVDEAHHVRAKTYQDIINAYPDAVIIGLTATPCRGDGRGLGNVFQTLIDCPQIRELIDLGRLVKPKIFAPPPPDLKGVTVASTGDYVISELSERVDTDPLVGDIVEHWAKHSQRLGLFRAGAPHALTKKKAALRRSGLNRKLG